MSGDARNRTSIFKYVARRSALLSLILFVPLFIITVREAFDSGIPIDQMTIWVIINLSFYLFELVINWTIFKNVTRLNRQKYFRISFGVDVLRYILTITGFVLFFGQPGMSLDPKDRQKFNADRKKIVLRSEQYYTDNYLNEQHMEDDYYFNTRSEKMYLCIHGQVWLRLFNISSMISIYVFSIFSMIKRRRRERERANFREIIYMRRYQVNVQYNRQITALK